MIDWNKYIGQSTCYDSPSDFRSFNDVAGCLALIPKQMDTPSLKKIRIFLEKYNRHPQYHGYRADENDIGLKELILGKTKYPDKEILRIEVSSKEMLQTLKGRMRWALNDAPYNLLFSCNQKIKWKKIPYKGSSSMFTNEWEDIENKRGEQLCTVSKEMLFEARDLVDLLSDEKWDFDEMSNNIRKFTHENWIRENAWDLDKRELRSIDIDKELGFKK